MIVKARLPERTEFLTGSRRRFAPDRKQNAIGFTFQSLDPPTQSGRASHSETGKHMNVIGHEHVTPNTNAKVGCATAVSDETRVYRGIGEQVCASVSVKCYKVDWCIEALEEQIQSRGLSLNARRTANVVTRSLLSAQALRFFGAVLSAVRL
jgi:hypothetical protein